MSRPVARLGVALVRHNAITPTTRSRVTWTCPDYRLRILSEHRQSIKERILLFSTKVRLQQDEPPLKIPPSTTAEASPNLPSVAANRRSNLSNRMSRVLDSLLIKASEASKHINAYTGTDFSGIESLRQEIICQENKVKSLHSEVGIARAEHNEAHLKQTGAQREIVGLLERKSNWTPADLERYMSLVRSEHVNEQAVVTAKEGLATAERGLEDARGLLERLERKQYHEEQIWSDTIRRNSTWVTFGLMGVNILLLLAQIAIFEPYRRKKIAQDVKTLLEEKEKVITGGVVPVTSPEPAEASSTKAVPEQPFDALLPPGAKLNSPAASPLIAGDNFAGAVPEVPHDSSVQSKTVPEPPATHVPKTAWEAYDEYFRDLFSERMIQIRKVELTNTALQGAATGVAMMGILLVLFRPH